MSRRREAAELARVLALSTQQAHDIADISPRSLSSDVAGNTQDSRELQLRMVETGQPLGTVSDDVHQFSSGAAGGAPNAADSIQSFTPSRPNANVSPREHPYLEPSGTSVPQSARQIDKPTQALSRVVASDITTSSLSALPLFSPTQISEPRVASATGQPDKTPISSEKQSIAKPIARTPLRVRGPNQRFQLSSSPVEAGASPNRRQFPRHSSELEVIEAIESARADSAVRSSSTRAKLVPEVVLRKSSSRAETYSPDPLDCLSSRLSPTKAAVLNTDAPRSSMSSAVEPIASGSSNIGTGRRSTRVKAAEEKKEAEKEERRRLRRERKAREEAERQKQAAPAGGSKRETKRGQASSAAGKGGIDATPASGEQPSKHKRIRLSNAGSATIRSATHESGTDLIALPETPAVEGVISPVPAERREASQPSDSAQNKEAQVSHPSPAGPTAIAVSPAKASGAEADDSMAATTVLGDNGGDDQNTTRALVIRTAGRSASPAAQRGERFSTPARYSPGPSHANGSLSRPGGIKWQTSRSDLTSVLSKFPGSRLTGMSKRHRIAPLHATIGPPAKALPPAPQKPVKKKKADESDEEEDDADDSRSEDEHGDKKPKKKEKGIEWFMVED